MTICDSFKSMLRERGIGTHYCELPEHKWSMMYYNSSGETCACKATDDEVAMLLTDDTVAESFKMIGESVDEWDNNDKRQSLCDKALELMENGE